MKLKQVKLPSFGGPSNTQMYRADQGWEIEFHVKTQVISLKKGDDVTLFSAVGAEMKPLDVGELRKWLRPQEENQHPQALDLRQANLHPQAQVRR